MQRPAADHWRKILLVYILQLFSYATLADHMKVELIAPQYVTYRNSAELYCNHTVSDNLLHKIEFMKNNKRIFQYIKERNPPYIKSPRLDGAVLEYGLNGTTIKLHDVRFEASGIYTCEVAMTTPIYTAGSNSVQMKVIVPQEVDPEITFEKNMYVIGESLEANCTSSAAHPVPYITWFINNKEVDISLVNHYPHQQHKNSNLMSATARLKVEVSELHAGENGHLEMSCRATIPDFIMQHEQFADIRNKTVKVQIISATETASSAAILVQELTLPMILCILSAMHEFIP